MNFQELARKKIIGVPVLYWALAGVTVLGFVAWKLKPASSGATTGASSTTDAQGNGVDGNGDAYSGLATTGTVVVQPSTQPVADVEKATNEKWLSSAVNYLVNDAKAATVGDAQLALSSYLNGDDLTYDQGQLRDKAVQKLGLPPESIGKIGITGSQPAQKQFSVFPGKHTVKGPNDNTPAKLATLYYGSAGDHALVIVEANTQYGTLASVTYPVGTVLTIPNYPVSKYYKVTGKNGDQYFANIGKTHGLSVAQVQALNPGIPDPAPVGKMVRYQ